MPPLLSNSASQIWKPVDVYELICKNLDVMTSDFKFQMVVNEIRIQENTSEDQNYQCHRFGMIDSITGKLNGFGRKIEVLTRNGNFAFLSEGFFIEDELNDWGQKVIKGGIVQVGHFRNGLLEKANNETR